MAIPDFERRYNAAHAACYRAARAARLQAAASQHGAANVEGYPTLQVRCVHRIPRSYFYTLIEGTADKEWAGSSERIAQKGAMYIVRVVERRQDCV